jgi:hypothetical protein
MILINAKHTPDGGKVITVCRNNILLLDHFAYHLPRRLAATDLAGVG